MLIVKDLSSRESWVVISEKWPFAKAFLWKQGRAAFMRGPADRVEVNGAKTDIGISR